MEAENGIHNNTCTMHNGYYSKQITGKFKNYDLHPALYILMQKAVILNTCCIIRTFLAEQWITSAWSVRPVFFENQLNCCDVRKVDDNDDKNMVYKYPVLGQHFLSDSGNTAVVGCQ
jgi:hypothetical protein